MFILRFLKSLFVSKKADNNCLECQPCGSVGTPRPVRRRHNTATAAVFLGMTPAALKNRRLRGTGPCYYKDGRSVVYLESDLVAWANKNPKYFMPKKAGM